MSYHALVWCDINLSEKTMKKQKLAVISLLLIIVLSSIFIFASCDEKQDNDTCVHKDLNRDGICDICKLPLDDQNTDHQTHVDENNNGFCDICGYEIVSGCEHKDEDNDGKCDTCKLSVVVNFDFYAINDIHGTFAKTDSNNGVGGLTTYLLDAQKNNNAFVLSSGDTWQGSTESNNTKGKLGTEWLNYINCVSMTLGNHEFDWTTDAIKTNADIADFPILAINVYDRKTNERVPYCDASVMISYDGIQIGIIGAIGDCYSSISASACSDVYFKVKDELTALIKAESESLKAQGADYVILSLHDGQSGSTGGTVYDMDWYDSTLSNGYIDLVFEGHTHSSYVIKDKYGVYHAQAGGYNKGISHASITVNSANGNSATSANIVSYSTYSSYAEDDIIDDLIELYKNEIGNPDEILGYNSKKRSSNDLAEAMAQAYYQLGEEEWGDEYQIVLGGGYIKSRSPYSLSTGNVTVRDLQALFPFDNTMMLCIVKGSDLWDKFFNTQNNNYHIAYGTYGAQVKENLKNGIGLSERYYIVVDSYTSDYAYNNLTVAKSLGNNIFPRDVLANYLLTNGWLS